MNYHYIEYMIKEQRREERQECKTRRLLAKAESRKQMDNTVDLKAFFRRVRLVGNAFHTKALGNILPSKAKG